MLTIKRWLHIILIGALLVFTTASCSDSEKLQPLTLNATILAFGNSLTYGTGASPGKDYPAQLEQITGHKVINAGLPGEISSKGLLRFTGLLKQYQPDLVILCHGGNDILLKLDLSQTSKNIQRMIDIARQYNSQVILIGVPEFGLFLDSSPIYEELAEHNHIPIENDILGEIIGNNSLKSDHIHPNSEGYRLLAEAIAYRLKEAGAIKN